MHLAVVVRPADVDAAPEALQQFETQRVGKVPGVYADSKYHNHAQYALLAENGWYAMQNMRRPKGAERCVKLPICS